MPLSFNELKKRCAGDVKNKAISGNRNYLLIGDMGVGKTTMGITGKRPVLAHSFDAGDLESVQTQCDEGWVIPNAKWEGESFHTPWAFTDWLNEVKYLHKEGAFEEIGTYLLSSVSGLNTAIMNKVMGGARVAKGDMPLWEKDYAPTTNEFLKAMRFVTSLPCDVILTAHTMTKTDAKTGRMFGYINATSSIKVLLPTLFSEVYYLDVAPNPKDFNQKLYRVHTKPEGIWNSRTRMGAGNKLANIETFPSIEFLNRRAKLPFQHKSGFEIVKTHPSLDYYPEWYKQMTGG